MPVPSSLFGLLRKARGAKVSTSTIQENCLLGCCPLVSLPGPEQIDALPLLLEDCVPAGIFRLFSTSVSLYGHRGSPPWYACGARTCQSSRHHLPQAAFFCPSTMHAPRSVDFGHCKGSELGSRSQGPPSSSFLQLQCGNKREARPSDGQAVVGSEASSPLLQRRASKDFAEADLV
jgi:hypothetical protein